MMFNYIPPYLQVFSPNFALAVTSHLTLLSVLATHFMYLFYTYIILLQGDRFLDYTCVYIK